MKTEHELLKEICDKIWYDNFYFDEDDKIYLIDECWIYDWWSKGFYKINVREIIFTQEFWNLLWDYPTIKDREKALTFWLLNHLDNPVQYLADLLKI